MIRYCPTHYAWQGDDGMATNFHAQWQDFKEKAEVVKTKVLVDQRVLTALATHNCFEVDSILYIPYQINRTIPKRQQMEIQLVPL